jgi:hypothetical protein
MHLDRRIENRPYMPSKDLMRTGGFTLAIHATRRLTGGMIGQIYQKAAWSGRNEPFPRADRSTLLRLTGSIVALTNVIGVTRTSKSVWANPGFYHWKLGEVFVLREPIPCKGKSKPWILSQDVRERILEELG